MPTPSVGHLKSKESGQAKGSTRKTHSKSKWGCGTCKIRHLKCDEGKPFCNRCLSVGLRCDGYAHHYQPKVPAFKEQPKLLPPYKTKNSLPPVDVRTATVERPLSPFNRSEQDKRCFDFFRIKAVHKIFSAFDEGFWNQLVMQLSQTEPATWHSLLAFASIIEPRTLGETDNQLPAPTCRFALTHYTRAVGLLTSGISQSKPCIEVLLTNCYLFSALEMLLGNVEGAINQVQGGLQLIRFWRKANGDQPNVSIDTLFGPMFSLLITCAFIYGRRVSLTTEFPTEPFIPKPDSFESPYNAIVQFIQLAGNFLRSAKEFETYKFNNDLTDYDIYLASRYKRQISNRLEDWFDRFKDAVRRSNTSGYGTAELQAISVIRAGSKILSACIIHKFDLEETEYDAYAQDFKESLEVAQTFSDEGFSTENPPPVSPNHPFLMTHFLRTYLVATKCRNPQIRRRALLYLKTFQFGGRWNSAFWNARMMSNVAERAIEIEEEGLEDLKDETGSIVPSEWARIHEISIPSASVNDGKGKMVQFRQRINGHWVLRRELFMV